MSISSRIQAIEQHLTDDYSVLTLAGADLTNVNKNILNLKTTWQERLLYFINNGTDIVWNNWDKVTGEGTTLTLNNTKEAPMKINLKGNTSQTTTTGKNICELVNFGTITQQGVTFKNNGDGSITLTGQADNLCVFRFSTQMTLTSGTTYYINGGYSENISINFRDSGNTQYGTSSTGATSEGVFTPSSNMSNMQVAIRISSGTQANITLYPMVALTSGGDYEPYTNGASPNPDYPQDIHVVSGDNKINVCGENIFQMPTSTTKNGITYTLNDNGTFNISGTATALTDFVNSVNIEEANIVNGGTYTLYFNELMNFSGMVAFYNGITWLSTPLTISPNARINSATFTIPSNCTNINFIIRVGNGVTVNQNNAYCMLVKGTYTSSNLPTFKPYQGNTYPVNLGVENYLPNNATTQTINGITYTINEDKSIKINGTASGRADLWLYGSITDTGNYVFIPKGNYTMNTANLNDGTMFLSFREKTAGVRYMTRQNNGLLDLLAQQDCYFYGIMLGVESGKTINNLTFYPQIEKGTKLNSYTPYGTPPIELCKIGTYQDVIKKSTGKNLFDKSTAFLNKMVTGAGGLIDFTGVFSSDYIKVKPNTAYYVNEYIPTLVAFDKDKSSLGYIRNTSGSATFTTPNNCEYIRVRMFDASIDMTTALNNAMINEGSTALPYEPFGTGWYVKKEIGNVVLDGSESWIYSTSNSVFYSDVIKPFVIPSDFLCNYYKKIDNSIAFGNMTNGTTKYENNVNARLIIKDTRYTNASDFITWLSNNNVTVYYVLATPTYTEITDSTLTSQLEALKKAISYDEQTNISQNNNDLPFIINATALREME